MTDSYPMPADQRQSFLRVARLVPQTVLGLLLWNCLLLMGCSKPVATEVSTGETVVVPSGPTASEIMQKIRAVYHKADSYADNSVVVFYAVVRSSGIERETPFTRASIAFQRPNQLYLTYQKNISSPLEERFEVVSNGLTVRSTAQEIPDQVHEAIAPLQLSPENFILEPALRGAILDNSIENTFPQLALLLTEDAEQVVFPGEAEAQLLSEAELGGKSHHRLELPSPAGNRILWIDPENFKLRRMELPVDNQREQINARGQYTKFAVWIDFENVTFNSTIESKSFELAVPEGARRVRRFIPPPPAAPPEFLGKPVGQFVFKTLEGKDITPETLEGKITVLDFWATNCPPCRAQTPLLNQVYEHFKGEGNLDDDVTFFAVSTDSRVVTNDVVKNTLSNWGGQMPIARDPNSSGYHDLNVRQTPTLLLMDREGRLQSLQIGAHQRAEPLIDAIQRLIDGESLAASEREKHADNLVKYEQALDAAEITDSIVEVEVARPVIEPRQLPKKLELKKLWQTSADVVERPGDVLLTGSEQGETLSLLVLDAGQAIVELDNAGKKLGRHKLPEHAESAHGFLRSWSDAQGKRWTLASGVGWQQVYVFDDQWRQTLSFPDEPHSGIGDVLFADLTQSGTPVMHVGYWGGLGVQGGTLDGRRLWSNRRLDHVLQVGVGPTLENGERTIWCTSTRGTVTQLSAQGKSKLERYVDGKALMAFASQPDHKQHCGLAVGKVGQYQAVGFDQSDSPTWEYTLPPGEYVEQVPRILATLLPSGDAGWLVVAAGGSLHWLDLQGQLLDRFDYGDILTGVATHSLGEQLLLFVATARELTAWQVNSPPPKPRVEPSPTEAKKPDMEKSSDDGESTSESSEPEESAQPETTESSEN